MLANEKPAHGWHREAGLNQRSQFNYIAFVSPNETAARFRRALPNAKAAAVNGGYDELLNYAEALVNACECSTCAFFDSGQCKAWPPRLVVVNGLRESAWPPVSANEYCGSWRSA